MPARNARQRITRKEFLRATGALAGSVVGGGLLAGAVGAAPARVALAAGFSPGGQPAPALRLLRTTPATGATGVCKDTQLSIAFDQTPRIGTSGRIRVVRADGTVVDTIDLAAS